MKSKVYFTRNINPEGIITLYEKLGRKLDGKVAVKLHSGEDGNQNYVKPEFVKPIIDHLNATVVECNTAYAGKRNSTKKHLKLLEKHGWSETFDVDLMDAEGPDLALPVKNGFHLKENYVGKNITNYDSMLILSHFKGHPMGGYGGALKQLSIGCASTEGKAWIHSAGKTKSQFKVWLDLPPQDDFLESMADAASTVVERFGDKIAYINLMVNMSVDCDCVSDAEDPCMQDIGMLASLDPIAIDQACVDLVKNSDDPGRDHLLERINSRNGEHTIEASAKLGFGSRDYELIEI